MDNKMILIVGIIVAVAAVAAGGYYILSGNDGGGAEQDSENKGLWVLGNADFDYDIDEDDVKYIQNKIDNGNLTELDRFWCDANHDGTVDSKDVEFVKKLIAGTATEIHYLNYNGIDSDGKLKGGATKFAVPDADKPLYLMLEGRCLAEEVLVITNKNPSHYIVCAASKQCFDYDKQLQFSTYEPASGQKVMETTNRAITSEQVATLEKIYVENNDATYSSITKGNLVLCMGAEDTYNKGIEEKISSYGSTQVVRLPSWEKGYTVSGLLTFAYLFGTQGEISGTTSWDMAKAYMKWNEKYVGIVTDAVSKISEKKSMLNMTVKEDAGSYTYTVQSTGTDPYNYSVLAGADNLGSKFGGAQSNGSIAVTRENLATYAKNVDVIILQIAGDAFDPSEGPNNAKTCLSTGVAALDGYVSPDADIYSMSFAIFNGAPYVVSMVLYAKYMYNDVSAIGALDFKTIYGGYLDLIGWGDRDLDYLVMSNGPGHTAKSV